MMTDKIEDAAPEMVMPTPSQAQDPMVMPEMSQGNVDMNIPGLQFGLNRGLVAPLGSVKPKIFVPEIIDARPKY